MHNNEFQHIGRLIREINKVQAREQDKEYSQRDFEFLIESIFMKTNGRISLSTIKRIWDHQNQYLPRVSTLDILSRYIGYSNWSEFKLKSLDKKPVRQKGQINKSRLKHKITSRVVSIILIILVPTLLLIFWHPVFNPGKMAYDEVIFEVEKVIGTDVPTTVLFNYDVSQIEFDSAFIQLSWNRLERFPISKDENILTSMYYIPGIHEAKLINNDSIVKTQSVFIKYDKWLTLFRGEPDDIKPVYIVSPDLQKNGFIHASNEVLSEFKADTSRESYYVSYLISRDFNVDGDNFSFETTIRNATDKGKFYCNYSSIYIYGQTGGIYLTLNQPGCVGSTGIVVGDRIISGQRNDLSSLGKDYSKWQKVRGKVEEKNFMLFINDTLVLETSYREDIGNILTWQYFFMGNGAVDDIILVDKKGETVFSETF